MQDEGNLAQSVDLRVFGDTRRSAPQDCGRGGSGTVAPGPVRSLVQIAIAAGQIAAAVHLDDELTERDGGRADAAGARRRAGRRLSGQPGTPCGNDPWNCSRYGRVDGSRRRLEASIPDPPDGQTRPGNDVLFAGLRGPKPYGSVGSEDVP